MSKRPAETMGAKMSKKKAKSDETDDGFEYASSCLIPTTPKKFKLIEKRPYNHDRCAAPRARRRAASRRIARVLTPAHA